MSLKFASNLEYYGERYLDERQLQETIADMVSLLPTDIPPGFIVYCVETGKRYEYNKDNEVDEVTGKWREYVSSAGVDFANLTEEERLTLVNEIVEELLDQGFIKNKIETLPLTLPFSLNSNGKPLTQTLPFNL